MTWGLGLRRLWLDVSGARIALCVAGVGALLACLRPSISNPSFDPALPPIAAAVAAGALVWILARIGLTNRTRRRLAQSLRDALATHAEDADTVAHDAFPDIPFWTGREWIYFAGEKGVKVRRLDQLAWAYAENVYPLHGYQLVCWDRDSSAIVLPVRRAFLRSSLKRIAQAAPWMPVGYSEALKDTWNEDHADLMALIESNRQAGRHFDEPWAGDKIPLVTLDS
jgi:hypothetical protein